MIVVNIEGREYELDHTKEVLVSYRDSGETVQEIGKIGLLDKSGMTISGSIRIIHFDEIEEIRSPMDTDYLNNIPVGNLANVVLVGGTIVRGVFVKGSEDRCTIKMYDDTSVDVMLSDIEKVSPMTVDKYGSYVIL